MSIVYLRHCCNADVVLMPLLCVLLYVCHDNLQQFEELMVRFDTVMSEDVHLKATVKQLQDDIAKAVQERDTAVQVQLRVLTLKLVLRMLCTVHCKHSVRALLNLQLSLSTSMQQLHCECVWYLIFFKLC
jgi:hypothetical protein